jgi:membrane protease YdiL (CAAX protease family)
MAWRPAPGWPEPPPGWVPPAGWKPSPDWPAPPADWQFWAPARAPESPRLQPPPPQPPPSPAPLQVTGASRRDLVLETWFVQLAFLLPGVMAAVDTFAAHTGGAVVTEFPRYVANPAANLILGVMSYLAVAVPVPIALLLLSRSGQRPAALGLSRPRWRADLWPGLGLAAAAYGFSLVTVLLLTALVGRNSKLLVQIPAGHVPAYYVIYGIAISLVTAVTEETMVSGYLLTRLEQLGWNPRRALVLSLVLRTSYHVYYGLGFLATIPFGYLVTRSFQKRRRLARPIVAHFLYDAVLISIAVLTSRLTRWLGACRPASRIASLRSGKTQSRSMMLAPCSPIIIAGAFVFPPVMAGMTEASATRSPSTPSTRSSGSTTARSSVPIRQVPTAW